MMRLGAVAAAVIACVFAYLLATGLAAPEAAGVRAMFVVSSVALALSAASAILALTMSARLRAQRIEIRNLARSVDAAFTDLARRERTAAQGASSEDDPAASDGTAMEPETPTQQRSDLRPIQIANTAPYPVAPRTEADGAGARNPADADGDETADVRLAPIQSPATGAIAGFDVLADETGQADGFAAAAASPHLLGISDAAAERRLVMAAIAASGRPDFAGGHTPLHVAVSEALLADRTELTSVVEALRRLNGTARSLILSLPTHLMENPAHHAAALARLAATRSRLAARGWPSSQAGIEALWRSGVSFLRLPAARLIGGDHQADAISLLEQLAASGITAIATDVHTEGADEDLATLGVMLMTAAVRQDALRSQPANGSGKPTHM
jgi:hypothetical protein